METVASKKKKKKRLILNPSDPPCGKKKHQAVAIVSLISFNNIFVNRLL